MTTPKHITVAYGDGIGPEIMEATLSVLAEAKAQLNIETIQVGEAQYKRGHSTGIPEEAWDSLRRTRLLLKAPITTPQGGGYKSLNVTMRKALGLYSNVRPTVSYHPFVKTNHPKMDLVIIRENEEDLYAGIEYRQSDDMAASLKLITRTGSERIIRYAFDYAIKNNRKKVTCMSKDNIMKMSDGIFHKTFDEIGAEYKDIVKEHYIIDIGAARIANSPERFDVIVTENLYGDIISDIAAEVSGSVGLAGSANIGENFAMFEAIHGSAPDIAGQNIANPSGLLNGALMMLVHIGQQEKATLIHNAWLATLEAGMHTADIYGPDSKRKVNTQEFAAEVIARFGETPKQLKKADYGKDKPSSGTTVSVKLPTPVNKTLVGVDVFIHWREPVEHLANKLHGIAIDGLGLKMISSKGLKVWPGDSKGINVTDQFCCRYVAGGNAIAHGAIIHLLEQIAANGMDFTKIENLYMFGETAGFSMGQGE